MSGDQTAAMSLEHVSKSYLSTTVLHDVSLAVRPGECLALVGENGAGKSTLVGIMGGKIAPTGGSLRRDGAPVVLRSPRDARAHGIAVIPQELAYVPDLTVAENVMLANWPPRRVFARQGWMRARCDELLHDLNIDIDSRTRMIELPLADRQLVEVAKALARHGRVLVLDEPTAALHAHEAQSLLAQLRMLKRQGMGIVYISHRLDECFRIADRIAVLRNGNLVDDAAVDRTTIQRTVELMLGRNYQQPAGERAPQRPAEVLLEVDRWTRDRQPALRGASFSIRSGEVLGVFGLVGSGAEAIARSLGGHDRHTKGALVAHGRRHRVPRSPRRARRLSIAYIPAERKTDGLALSQNVADNAIMMVLGRFTTGGWVHRRAQIKAARELVGRFDVRCGSVTQEIAQLSGGNQQKVLLASRLVAEPSALVLHEPTRGVDIGSRAQIHRMLADFARRGAAVVVVTSDLQEAIGATDRLLVMRTGRIVGELTAAEKTAERALALAAVGDPGAGVDD